MPLIYYDFQCKDCHEVYEALVTPDTRERQCPECGLVATRLISKPHLDYRMGSDPDMPTMASKWAKMHSNGQNYD
jgi:putative FmdB family regulatory protein